MVNAKNIFIILPLLVCSLLLSSLVLSDEMHDVTEDQQDYSSDEAISSRPMEDEQDLMNKMMTMNPDESGVVTGENNPTNWDEESQDMVNSDFSAPVDSAAEYED